MWSGEFRKTAAVSPMMATRPSATDLIFLFYQRDILRPTEKSDAPTCLCTRSRSANCPVGVISQGGVCGELHPQPSRTSSGIGLSNIAYFFRCVE